MSFADATTGTTANFTLYRDGFKIQEKKKDTPSLAMMLVIDKSGSMEGDNLQLAKEAAIATVEVLSDRDYVGVLTFDADPYVVAELQSAANKAGIVQNIERIEAGGGTAMYPPMERACEALRGVYAAFRHCIVLTDGVSQPGDFEGITSQMAGEQITVSTVAVGQDIDAELLQNIARWGKGRYYQITDPHDIPSSIAAFAARRCVGAQTGASGKL